MAKHLLADFGGTNARLILTDDAGALDDATLKTHKCADFNSPADIFKAYLLEKNPADIDRVVLAVAGPVASPSAFRFTNNPEWGAVDFQKMPADLGLRVPIELINDFAAQSYATLLLGPKDYEVVAPGNGEPFYPSVWARSRMTEILNQSSTIALRPANPKQRLAIIGPGTGLGVATAMVAGGQFQVIDGEGGHIRFPARTRSDGEFPKSKISGQYVYEQDVIRRVSKNKGNVSISMETICSGEGIKTVFNSYCYLTCFKEPKRPYSAEEIVKLAAADLASLSEPDRSFQVAAKATTDLLSRALGRVCAVVALTNKTQGGIVLSGGVLGKLGSLFNQEAFKEEFHRNDLGINNFVKDVPVMLVKHAQPGLLGAAAYAQFVPAQ
jgi:glucokinase